jgi:hypothetical protein
MEENFMWHRSVTTTICAIASAVALSSPVSAQTARQNQLRAITEGVVWGYLSAGSAQGNLTTTYLWNMYILKNHNLGSSNYRTEFFFGILIGNQTWQRQNLGFTQNQIYNSVSSVVNQKQSIVDEVKKNERSIWKSENLIGYVNTQATWSNLSYGLFR